MGGEYNRWLNISQIELAEDPDSKIFQCEVCIARGTPSEECHIANYTNRVTGGPPMILEANSKNLVLTFNGMYIYKFGGGGGGGGGGRGVGGTTMMQS